MPNAAHGHRCLFRNTLSGWFPLVAVLISDLIAGLVAGHATAGEKPDSAEPIKDAVVAELEQQAGFVTAAANAGHLPIRGVLRFAVEAAGNDWNPEAVETALRLARSMQETTVGHPHFGNFRWRSGDREVTDLNAVEFAVQSSSVLRLKCFDRLTPSARELLDAMHRDAAVAMRNHAVRPGYTNIHLMKTWNHLALGHFYGDDVEQAGRRLWSEWLDYTRQHGLTEYVSPTYYGTDLDSLGLITRFARDETIRRQAQATLELIWSSIAAHWFVPSERIAGPHSRDYDYLYGRGYSDEHLYEAGWLSFRPAAEAAGWLPGPPHRNLSVFRNACRRDVSPDVREGPLATLPRFVVQRFNAEPWARSTTYLSGSIAIGVAGECRGPEDKTLSVQLPGDRQTPNMALVFDGRGDPYGRIKSPAGFDGHRKAHHLRPFVISSQRGPRVTAAWAFDPVRPPYGAKPTPLSCLQAHLVMPRDAEIWARGERQADDSVLPPDSVVFVRRGDAVVGIRFVPDTDRSVCPTRLVIATDDTTGAAKRLSAVFAEEPPTRAAVLVLDIEVRECRDEREWTGFRDAFMTRSVSAVISGDRLQVEGTLPLTADLARFSRILCEPLLDPETLLLVNGQEIGRPLMRLK